MKTRVAFFVIILLLLISMGLMHWHYSNLIGLYKDRLRETLDRIHELQHTIDPHHEQFSH